MIDAIFVGLCLIAILFGIAICLYWEGDKPPVTADLTAARTAAGKPIVLQSIHFGQSADGTPIQAPIKSLVGAARITSLPAPSDVQPGNQTDVDLEVHVSKSECGRLADALGGRCAGPVELVGPRREPTQLELRAPDGPVHIKVWPGPAKELAIDQSSLATQQQTPTAWTMALMPTRRASLVSATCDHATPIELASTSRRYSADCSPGPETYRVKVATPSPKLLISLNEVVAVEAELDAERVSAEVSGAQLLLDGDSSRKAESGSHGIEISGSRDHPVRFWLDTSNATEMTSVEAHSSGADVEVDGDLQNASELHDKREYVLAGWVALVSLLLGTGVAFLKALPPRRRP